MNIAGLDIVDTNAGRRRFYKPNAFQVDTDYLIKFFFRCFFYEGKMTFYAGIIECDIQFAERLYGFGYELLYSAALRYVCRYEMNVWADLL